MVVAGCATTPSLNGPLQEPPLSDLAASASSGAPDPSPASSDLEPTATPRELFEVHCSACHDLAVAVSQRLDRSTWEWVLEDMVEQYGLTWLSDAEVETIVDYLTETYGPDSPSPQGTQ